MIATWLFSHYQNFPFAWTTNGPYELNIKIRELCCCCHSWPPKGHLAIIQSFMWEWMENIRELVSLLRSNWSITSTPYFLWFVIICTQCIFSSKKFNKSSWNILVDEIFLTDFAHCSLASLLVENDSENLIKPWSILKSRSRSCLSTVKGSELNSESYKFFNLLSVTPETMAWLTCLILHSLLLQFPNPPDYWWM